ncbi:beta strand repeat-containing protein [Tundrisphaera sp. TA3]|uniref:beta strand repeat-containing protein n=1 Tax=Tundrisphaera sp. TA3 TaxID=3435775 RepID=UPI003EBCDDB5
MPFRFFRKRRPMGYLTGESATRIKSRFASRRMPIIELLEGRRLLASLFEVTPTLAPTATDNDYTRIASLFDGLTSNGEVASGDTVLLSGRFDWSEPNARSSWSRGNNGVAGDLDDYHILIPPNLNNVTFTSPLLGGSAAGGATIVGPGDVATVDLEGFLAFEPGALTTGPAATNSGWTISNLEIDNFDLAIGMGAFRAVQTPAAFDNTTIAANIIRVPADLNASVAPADVFQNIGIYFSFGANQTIGGANGGNTIILDGSGASNGTNRSSMVGIQSDSYGTGLAYNGLLIDQNTITVTGAQAPDAASIVGIWENGSAHGSQIRISNNRYTNSDASALPANNRQTAYRTTTLSRGVGVVTFDNNTSTRAHIGLDLTSGYADSGLLPVQVINSNFINNDTGILITTGASPGSGGLANIETSAFVGPDNGAAGVGVRIGVGASATLFRNQFGNTESAASFNLNTGVLVDGGTLTSARENFISNSSSAGISVLAGSTVGPIFNNNLSGTASAISVAAGYAGVVNASGNYYGTNTPAGVAARVTAGKVDYTPWLDVATDVGNDPANGFQGSFAVLNVDDDSPQVGSITRINEAYSIAEANGITPVSNTAKVHAGTYLEDPIQIAKTFSIIGQAALRTDVVIRPTTDTGGDRSSNGGFIRVLPAQTFNVSNVTFDGTGRQVLQTIQQNGSGVIDNTLFQNLRYGPNEGRTVEVRSGTGNVSVTNSRFQNVGRIGVEFSANGATGLIDSNTYVGKGNVQGIDYGFQVSGGSTVTISRNNISDTTAVADDLSSSAGIFVLSYNNGGAQSVVTITDNVITRATTGIVVGFQPGDTSRAKITGNTIDNSTTVAGLYPTVGVSVISATAFLQGNTLIGNTDVALEVTDGALVDAGQIGSAAFPTSDVTLFGISTGGNTFTVPAGALAIRNTNVDGIGGPRGRAFDVSAQGNTFTGTSRLIEVEGLINHDIDTDGATGFVNYFAPFAQDPPSVANPGGPNVNVTLGAAADRALVYKTGGRYYINDVFLGSDPTVTSVTVNGNGGNDDIDASLFAGTRAFAVTLDGGAGNDTLIGGEGNDSIFGGANADSIVGGLGNDTIVGGLDDGTDSGDTISGGLGNDSITGGGGNDSIDGGAGTDSILGQSGNDTINGGDDNDTIDGGVGTDSIVGGLGDDSLSGGQDNDTIDGGDGADNIAGGDGNDSLLGSAGNDTITGGLGNDFISAGADNDSVNAGDGNDTIVGGSGNDTIVGGLGDDSVIDGMGDDSIDGGDGNDSILAGLGNDTIVGGLGNDTIDAGDGDDVVTGGGGADSILGGLGNDSITAGLDSENDNDTVSGGAGNDTIFGGGGNDLLSGDGDNDSISGQSGVDTITGGLGNDVLDGGTGNDSIQGNAGNDSLVGGDGNDTLEGNAGVDTLVGGLGNDLEILGDVGDTDDEVLNAGTDPGNDTLIGGGGNDTIIGGGGNDSILGGGGNDVITVVDGPNPGDAFVFIVDGQGGNDSITGGGFNDTLSGGDGNDTIVGGAGNDSINGNAGFDSLTGGLGNDIVILGDAGQTESENLFADSDPGDDTLIGNDGNNIIFGGNGNDTILGMGGDDTLSGLTNGFVYRIEGGTGNDTLTGADGNDTLLGQQGVDKLSGLAGNDILTFGDNSDLSNETYNDIDAETGDDTINGGGGNDTIFAGNGNDRIFGDDGNDLLRVNNDTNATVAYLDGGAGNDIIRGGAGNDSLFGGLGNDSILGNGGNDLLEGNDGNDTLNGAAGNDTLDGGTGTDFTTGGAGSDEFRFESTTDPDAVSPYLVDFIPGQDRKRDKSTGNLFS